jgi:hypothetical protein
MVLFTVLNGMGVVFLVYVLIQFWKEGHRSRNRSTRQYAIEFLEENRPEVIVVMRPIPGGLPFGTQGKQVEPAPVSHSAQAGVSVVSMRARESSVQGRQLHRVSGGLQVEPAPDSADRADEASMKRFSTR